ncbi:MAG: right-handed parallel beta-helix repeat-containing protein [Phycisphaerales bacterium]|nr:right-handed parallel beta-helix repeat-containing protein [Phycisphaerales bacterium]
MQILLTSLMLMVVSTSVLGRIISVPADKLTIQEAIDSAAKGDRIVVAPGIYTEAIRIEHKEITVESETGPERTLIDATGLARPVVTCIGSSNDLLIIRGFSLTGGLGDGTRYGPAATIGGGLLIRGGSPTIENCRIVGNVVTYEGGGAWIGGEASPRFLRCTFTSNRAERGGGILVEDSQAALVDCRFMACIAIFAGGGIVADNSSTITITDSTFEECSAAHNGGAIYVYESIARIERCIFVRNTAGLSGGAIYQGFNARATQIDLQFRTLGDSVAGQWYSDMAQQPKGACCIESLCIEVTEHACLEAGGRWAGSETDCIAALAAACPVPQPGDLNSDKFVDIRDVAIMMSLWGDDLPQTQPSPAAESPTSDSPAPVTPKP